MQYVLMFVDRPHLRDAVPPERLEKVYGEIYQWFETQYAAGHIANGGAELQPPETATTLHAASQGEPVVADGPFSEAKEVIGGFTVIEVPDHDTAVSVARTWPGLQTPGVSVELRPIVDHSDDVQPAMQS